MLDTFGFNNSSTLLIPYSEWLLLFSSVSVIQISHGMTMSMSQHCVPSGPLWCTNRFLCIIQVPLLGPNCYVYFLIRAWVCPPRPLSKIIPHSFWGHVIFFVFAASKGPLFQSPIGLFSPPNPMKKTKEIWCISSIRWAPTFTHQGAIY